jgi:hypothetical protein
MLSIQRVFGDAAVQDGTTTMLLITMETCFTLLYRSVCVYK